MENTLLNGMQVPAPKPKSIVIWSYADAVYYHFLKTGELIINQVYNE